MSTNNSGSERILTSLRALTELWTFSKQMPMGYATAQISRASSKVLHKGGHAAGGAPLCNQGKSQLPVEWQAKTGNSKHRISPLCRFQGSNVPCELIKLHTQGSCVRKLRKWEDKGKGGLRTGWRQELAQADKLCSWNMSLDPVVTTLTMSHHHLGTSVFSCESVNHNLGVPRRQNQALSCSTRNHSSSLAL